MCVFHSHSHTAPEADAGLILVPNQNSSTMWTASREGDTDSIWYLNSGLSGQKWGIWYPDNFPQIIRILGLQIWANSINIWLKYDPKTLSYSFKDRSHLLKSFFIHHMKEIHLKIWLQFSDCGCSLRSFFTHMKEVYLEIWFYSSTGTNWNNSTFSWRKPTL